MMNFILRLMQLLRPIMQNALIISQKNKMDLFKVGGGHTVWCNPPYCRKTGLWVKKAYEEHQRTGCTVVMLLPSRTDVRWFHDYILGKAEIRFIKGRLKFGGNKNSAPFPSIVVIYR